MKSTLKAVKTQFSDVYHDTLIGRVLLSPVKFVIDSVQFNRKKDRAFIEKRFMEKLQVRANLDDPTTFNEKIQWLKLNDRQAIHTKCADKYHVREIVEKKIGAEYLIPLLMETTDIDMICAEKLPAAPFVIKTNHDSGNVFVITDKGKADFEQIRHQLKHSMRHNYYHTSREWQYKDITPKILVEALISDNEGKVPKDYKIHCFNGVPEVIQVDSDRFEDHKRNMFTCDWIEQPFQYQYEGIPGIVKPKNLEKILELAKILSEPFPFARIDFYDVGSCIYFGEITFHPESGFGRFIPNEWDEKLGNKLNLDSIGKSS